MWALYLGTIDQLKALSYLSPTEDNKKGILNNDRKERKA